jgi:SOS response regulatory protein OraA/RecX
MTDMIVKILVQLISTLAVATKQIKQGRLSESNLAEKFGKKFFGENDVEAVLQRLDRLTLDEARTTAAQTLDVVYCLVNNLKEVMGGE